MEGMGMNAEQEIPKIAPAEREGSGGSGMEMNPGDSSKELGMLREKESFLDAEIKSLEGDIAGLEVLAEKGFLSEGSLEEKNGELTEERSELQALEVKIETLEGKGHPETKLEIGQDEVL